jgi:hypothetical protein
MYAIMNSLIKFLEGNLEAAEIINMGELVVIEQVLKIECTLLFAGRVETSNAASAFVIQRERER